MCATISSRKIGSPWSSAVARTNSKSAIRAYSGLSHRHYPSGPRPPLFDLPYSPEWGYDERFFDDVEHRYTKMHRLLRERWGDPAGKRVVDLGSSRGLFLARFEGSERAGIEIDPDERARGSEHGVDAVEHFINAFDANRLTARLPLEDASADVVLAGEIIE